MKTVPKRYANLWRGEDEKIHEMQIRHCEDRPGLWVTCASCAPDVAIYTGVSEVALIAGFTVNMVHFYITAIESGMDAAEGVLG